MTLAPGTRLGPYEITAKLGEGGMGVVYRATDSRLGREVAIKVLPESVAQDAERLARFEREAKILASLNHANIAAIYGLEEGTSAPALVMELVEGPTLADRLAQGAIPFEEALPIARQIAGGLEYAHERGIIHRDLKPANIKLTPEGQVKILDFGLAKALNPDTASGPVDLSHSPTLTYHATMQGVIMGTASYMSPEQARGQAVDKRSDIWSFGVVLWEMLTAYKLFGGETVSDALAAILTREPDLSELPAPTPLALRRILSRCLERNPRDRLRDIGEARIALTAMASGEAESVPPPAAVERRGVSLPVFIGATVLALALGVLAAWRWEAKANTSRVTASEVTEFSVSAADLDVGWSFAFELSPNGERLAWRTLGGEKGRTLWVRALDDRTPREVAAAEKLGVYIWSPDAKELAYDDGDGRLWRVPAKGGRPEVVCELPTLENVPSRFALAGAWLPDGSILFAAWRGGVYRVPARGGEPELYVPIDPKVEVDVHQMELLPDGQSVLLMVHRQEEPRSLSMRPEILREGKRRPVDLSGDPSFMKAAKQVDTAGFSAGTLALLREGKEGSPALWGVPFDPVKGAIIGKRFVLAPHATMASLAADGTLAYVLPQEQPGEVLRVDRNGDELEALGREHPQLEGAAMSPDGSHLALVLGGNELWLDDLTRGTLSRLDKAKYIRHPQWTSDGRTIFYSAEGEASEIRRIAANPGAQAESLLRKTVDWTQEPLLAPDGTGMLVRANSFQLSEEQGLYWVPFTNDGKPSERRLLFEGVYVVGRLAPGSRMLAYSNMVDERRQAFLTTFPGLEQTIQLSSKEGFTPQWKPDGSALYYLADGVLIEVEVGTDASGQLTASREHSLFDLEERGLSGTSWSVAPDGKGFLFIKRLASEKPSEIVVVRNGLQRAEASRQ
jgi:hypothetical protein